MTKTTKPMKDKPEQKIEQVVGYLPYRLMTDKGELIGIEPKPKNSKYGHLYWIKKGWVGYDIDADNFKLILYPLSDLTKPKFSDGSKNSNPSWWKLKIQAGILDSLDYNTVQELLEKHYDLFSLIEKRLAIDVNELSSNPYK